MMTRSQEWIGLLVCVAMGVFACGCEDRRAKDDIVTVEHIQGISDSEDLIRAEFAVYREHLDLLKGITDGPSAQAAMSRVHEVLKKHDAIGAKGESMGQVIEARSEETGRLMRQMSKLSQDIFEEKKRLMADSDLPFKDLYFPASGTKSEGE